MTVKRVESIVLVGAGSIPYVEFEEVNYYSREISSLIGETVEVEGDSEKVNVDVAVRHNDHFVAIATEIETFRKREKTDKQSNGKRGF